MKQQKPTKPPQIGWFRWFLRRRRRLDKFRADLERLLDGPVLDYFGVSFCHLHGGGGLAKRAAFEEAQLEHAAVVLRQESKYGAHLLDGRLKLFLVASAR